MIRRLMLATGVLATFTASGCSSSPEGEAAPLSGVPATAFAATTTTAAPKPTILPQHASVPFGIASDSEPITEAWLDPAGSTISVRATTSPDSCHLRARLLITSTDDELRLRVAQDPVLPGPQPQYCELKGISMPLSAPLGRPVGDRNVLDDSYGTPVTLINDDPLQSLASISSAPPQRSRAITPGPWSSDGIGTVEVDDTQRGIRVSYATSDVGCGLDQTVIADETPDAILNRPGSDGDSVVWIPSLVLTPVESS